MHETHWDPTLDTMHGRDRRWNRGSFINCCHGYTMMWNENTINNQNLLQYELESIRQWRIEWGKGILLMTSTSTSGICEEELSTSTKVVNSYVEAKWHLWRRGRSIQYGWIQEILWELCCIILAMVTKINYDWTTQTYGQTTQPITKIIEPRKI